MPNSRNQTRDSLFLCHCVLANPAMISVDQVLNALDSARQRATYGAVAAVTRKSAQSLMAGRPRNPHNSWIVSSSDSLPTGYVENEMHPELLKRTDVLSTAA